jgi:hypothetical protein
MNLKESCWILIFSVLIDADVGKLRIHILRSLCACPNIALSVSVHKKVRRKKLSFFFSSLRNTEQEERGKENMKLIFPSKTLEEKIDTRFM